MESKDDHLDLVEFEFFFGRVQWEGIEGRERSEMGAKEGLRDLVHRSHNTLPGKRCTTAAG